MDDEGGIRKVQVRHDVPEFIESFTLAQAGIALLFLCDRGHEAFLVIVRGVDQGLVRPGEQLFGDASVKGIRIAILEVGPITPSDKQGFDGKDAIVKAV